MPSTDGDGGFSTFRSPWVSQSVDANMNNSYRYVITVIGCYRYVITVLGSLFSKLYNSYRYALMANL